MSLRQSIEHRLTTESPLLADTIEKALANPNNPLAKDYQAACWRAALLYDIEEEAAIHHILEAAKQRELDDEEMMALERYLEEKQRANLQHMTAQDAARLKRVITSYRADDRTAYVFKAMLTKLAFDISQLRQAETTFQQHQQAQQQWQQTQQQYINNVMQQLTGTIVLPNGTAVQQPTTVTLPNGQTIALQIDATTPEAQAFKEYLEKGLDPERSPTAMVDDRYLPPIVKEIHAQEVEHQQRLIEAKQPANSEEQRDRNRAEAEKLAARKVRINPALNLELIRLINALRHDRKTLDDINNRYNGNVGFRLNFILKNIAEQIMKGRRKVLEEANDKLIEARVLKRYDNAQIAKHVESIDNTMQRIMTMGENNRDIAAHIAEMRLADLLNDLNAKKANNLSELERYICGMA